MLRNCRRLQETEPGYTRPIPGGPPEESKPPVSGETKALGGTDYFQALTLRLSEEPHVKGKGTEESEAHPSTQASEAQVPSPVKWVWPGAERILPEPRDLEVPSASSSRF